MIRRQLERIEEAAFRTQTNFSKALKYMFFASDEQTATWLRLRGAAIAAELRAAKRQVIEPGQSDQAVAGIYRQLTLAADEEWSCVGAGPAGRSDRPTWIHTLYRLGLTGAILLAAILVPYWIGGEVGRSIRAGLIAVAIGSLFAPSSKTSDRLYDMIKSSFEG